MQNKIIVNHAEVQPVVMSMWFVQTIFWVILTVVTFFSLTLWYGTAELPHVLHTLLQSLIGLGLTIPMVWIYRKAWKLPPRILFLVICFAVLFFSLLWSALRLGAFIWLTEEGSEVWNDFGGWYFSGFFIFLCWTAVFYSMHYYRLASGEKYQRIKLVEKSRAEKVKRLHAEKMASESRMQMLRYQLNPHFLFNTLNAVSSLIVSKELTQARATVEQLSLFLRYALKEDKKGWVSLKSELEALELYLNIEKIRFSDRLAVEYDIEDEALKYQVPSLLLQPLVENSIKHAINTTEEGGSIWIGANVRAEQLELVVADNGPGVAVLGEGAFSPKDFQFSGVGIQNIVDRLENIYGDEADVHLINKEGKGLKVFIKLPFRK